MNANQAGTAAGPEDLLITREVAEWMRTSPETLRYWAWRGEGPKSFKAGRRRLYRRGDVQAWLDERRAAGQDGAA